MRVGALHHRQGLCRHRRGFTIIELMVVLGVVLVLVSMFVPTIAKTMEETRNTRDAAQLRQNVTLVDLYCNDHKGVYPVSHVNAWVSSMNWYRTMNALGLIQSAQDADPNGMKIHGEVRFWLSVCLVYSPEYMRPGYTLRMDDSIASAVRQDQVIYPSSKGSMLRFDNGYPSVAEGRRAWCCGPRWRTPIGFADGSILITDYMVFTNYQEPVIVDRVGLPVYSTWGGYEGRDR